MDAVLKSRPERTYGEEPIPEREVYLLKALLSLLLYLGVKPEASGVEKLVFTRPHDRVYPVSGKQLIG